MVDPVSIGITAGFKALSMFGQQGRTPAAPKSAEIYDYYQMVAKAKIVIDKLDPEKGSSVGKFGTISDSSIRTA